MEQMIPLISEFGFPIVMTLYLLYRVENKLDELIIAINVLPNQIEKKNAELHDNWKRSI